MMYLRKSWAFAAAAVAVAALLALGPPVRADFVITITEYSGANGTGSVVGSETIDQNYGAGTTTITTSGSAHSAFSSGATGTVGTGTTDNGSVNLDFQSTAVGDLTTVTGSAVAPPQNGDASGVPSVTTTQSTTSVKLTGGGSVIITEAVNNLGPLNGPLGSITSTLSNSAITQGSSDYLKSYYDAGNTTTAGAGVDYTGTQGPLTGANNPTTGFASATSTFSGSSPFAMSNVLTFNAGAGLSNLGSTGSTEIDALPEPASMALWLTGLPVLGLARLWRRRKQGPLAIA